MPRGRIGVGGGGGRRRQGVGRGYTGARESDTVRVTGRVTEKKREGVKGRQSWLMVYDILLMAVVA